MSLKLQRYGKPSGEQNKFIYFLSRNAVEVLDFAELIGWPMFGTMLAISSRDVGRTHDECPEQCSGREAYLLEVSWHDMGLLVLYQQSHRGMVCFS